MSENGNNHIEENAIFHYYKIAKKHIKLVAISTLGTMILAAIISLTIPNTYRSVSQLAIIPAKFQTELTPSSLSVKTCQDLLGSPEMIWGIKDKLLLYKSAIETLYENFKKEKSLKGKKDIVEQISLLKKEQIQSITKVSDKDADIIANFSVGDIEEIIHLDKEKYEKLKIENMKEQLLADVKIETKTNTSITYSPIITLNAKASRPILAKLMVSIWANNFVELYKDLSVNETSGSFVFLKEQYEIAKKDSVKIEAEITKFTEKTKLDLMKNQIKVLQIQLSDNNKKIEGLKFDYTLNYSKLAEVEKQLSSIEENGIWIGFLGIKDENLVEKQDKLKPAEIPQMYGDNFSNVIVENIRENSLAVRKALFEIEKQIEDYTKTRNFETVDRQKWLLVESISENENELTQLETSIDGLQKAVLQSEEILKNEPDKVDLDKSITDDALWMFILDKPFGKDLSKLEKIKLSNQEVNLIYQDLKIKLNDFKNELVMTKDQRDSMIKKINELKENLKENEKIISEYKTKTNILNSTESAVFQYYSSVSDAYTKLKEDQNQLRIDTTVLQAQIKETEKAIKKSEDEVSKLMDTCRKAIVENDLLTREKDKITKTYLLIEEKYEQARIASADNKPDIKIATKAIVPEKKVGPYRKLIVLCAGAIGFAFAIAYSIFLSLLSEYTKIRPTKTKI